MTAYNLNRGPRRNAAFFIALPAVVWLAVLAAGCGGGADSSRLGDYNDDGYVVVACLGDSNTCYGGAGECGEMVDPWCHQLREQLPGRTFYQGRARDLVVLNFGWNGARAASSAVRDFLHKPNDRFRLAAQLEWATDLEARAGEPRLRNYPRYTADVIIMAFHAE